MNIRISIIFTLLAFVLSCKSDEPTNTSTPETKPKPTYNVVSGLENEVPKSTVKPSQNNKPAAQTPTPSTPPQKELKRDKSLELIDQVNVQNPAFKVRKNKEDFDQILTFLGSRTLNGETEDLKFKLFFWEDKIRGYYETVYGGKNIQVFGYKEGNSIALKSQNNNVPQEDGVSMFGTFVGDQMDLTHRKGTVGEDGQITVKITDIEYPLIFYRTEDLIKYGKQQ